MKASMLRKHWQGFYVCPEHWEERQPQDFARGIKEHPTPPWVQPWPQDSFVGVCSPNSMSAVPGYAGAGCMVPGYVSPSFNPNINPGGSVI